MRKFVLVAIALVLLVIVGGAVVLASWNIPAPTGKIETPVADEKLAK